jgi:hypothetical protein
LLQTVRFLKDREPNLYNSEFIIVVQDELPDLKGLIWSIKQINLHSPDYCKPKGCNLAIKHAKYPIVALIDADRILPKNYFYEVACSINPGQFVTTKSTDQILHDCTDLQIEQKNFQFRREFRSKELKLGQKNLFSGNTVFFQDDYWKVGGKDEQFFGYGFADNDMSRTVLSANKEAVYLNKQELHLYHERNSVMDNAILEDDEIIFVINAMKYANKWKIVTENEYIDAIYDNVLKKLPKYPQYWQEQLNIIRNEFLTLTNT